MTNCYAHCPVCDVDKVEVVEIEIRNNRIYLDLKCGHGVAYSLKE